MRCFVAIELPDSARRALERMIRDFPPDTAKWCPADQLHLTLRFLGDVPEQTLPCVCRIVTAASAAVPPISFRLSACGAFPSQDRPRVIYCGLDDPRRGCEQWLAVANPDLDELGFDRETRPFTPHITLGRIRDPRNAARVGSVLANRGAELARFIPHSSFVADHVTLFESRLTPRGATYSTLHRAALGSEQALPHRDPPQPAAGSDRASSRSCP